MSLFISDGALPCAFSSMRCLSGSRCTHRCPRTSQRTLRRASKCPCRRHSLDSYFPSNPSMGHPLSNRHGTRYRSKPMACSPPGKLLLLLSVYYHSFFHHYDRVSGFFSQRQVIFSVILIEVEPFSPAPTALLHPSYSSPSSSSYLSAYTSNFTFMNNLFDPGRFGYTE